ncbi:polysaccharide deacetylase [Pullulanibacillus camelliae]|uniref:Polysaccharide deacetylase n=1 Tax=Pullulanibacillus camelliae TaxID=1707096 RepID=A0A8J2VKG7_9BACL|nr:polysaccharide deacetylase [Pullulanibacillus camelliae]GGE26999.1 polysaccharide deacetylase [Pullulanibacillus camelliae]
MNSVRYTWPEGKKCAVVLSFDFDGITPYLWRSRHSQSKGISEKEQRRFGPRQGIYRILELLEKWEIKGSFYIPGVTAEEYPQAVEAIAKCGHEIGLHGYLHERVDELTRDKIEETLIKGKAAIEHIVGQRKMGYRSPSWEMTEDTFEVIKKYEVLYDSSLMGADHPYWINQMVELPVQWLLDDAIFYRYVGGGASVNPPANPATVIDTWKKEFEGIKKYGGLFMLTMHPWLSGRGSRILALESLISYLKMDSEIWWATAQEVAAYHQSLEVEGKNACLTEMIDR